MPSLIAETGSLKLRAVLLFDPLRLNRSGETINPKGSQFANALAPLLSLIRRLSSVDVIMNHLVSCLLSLSQSNHLMLGGSEWKLAEDWRDVVSLTS